jgi:plasmid maintenance system antidote protein VapI
MLENLDFTNKKYIFATNNNLILSKMDREFENAATAWLAQCGSDLKNRIEKLLDENDSNPVELAEEINVAEEEIYEILEGNVENISVDTLIRVFMVLGLAVEVKPIEQTPLGCYDNVNPHVMREPQFEERRAPQPNPFTRQRGEFRPHGGMPFPPPSFDDVPPFLKNEFERRPPMPQHAPNIPRRTERASSPFAMMGREELTKIIRKKLWDTEIDINTASDRELVRFLEEKDKRMKEFARRDVEEKRNEELERDPQVTDFVRRMKQNIKDNPQFRSYMKNFLNKLDED